MAAIEDLRAWFERDIPFGSWENNVQVEETNPGTWRVRFYTDVNEYCLRLAEREDGIARVHGTVRSRKPRAGLPNARVRGLLPDAPIRLNERTWRRILAAIVGLELVRVHRRDRAEAETPLAAS